MTDPTVSSNPPADLIADILVNAGVFVDGWTFAVGRLPSGPDQVVAIIDSPGPSGFPSISLDFPGIQVMVRGAPGSTSYKDTWKKMYQVRDILLGIDNAPVEFPELWGCTERGQPAPLGYDDKDRPQFSWNAQLTVGPVPTADSNRVSA